jgi:serine/threonine protein kinase
MTFKNNIILITNYIDGISLKNFISSGYNLNLTKDDLMFIVYQLVNILHELHKKFKVAHKDLKPDNIMIDPITYKVSVIDFGLSCGDKKCKAGGTPKYMAPEMFFSYIDNKQLTFKETKRTDIFSLGIILLELLGCDKYFKNGTNVWEILLNNNMDLFDNCKIINEDIEYIIKKTVLYNNNKRMKIQDILNYLKTKKADVLYEIRKSLMRSRRNAINDYDTVKEIIIKLNDNLKNKFKRDYFSIIRQEDESTNLGETGDYAHLGQKALPEGKTHYLEYKIDKIKFPITKTQIPSEPNETEKINIIN